MAKLSDKQRKKIIAEFVNGSSMTTLAKKYDVSTATIHRVVHSDEKVKEKVERKKEENTQSVLAYMESKKNDVCDLIDRLLVAMNDPAKIAATPLSQLATSMGIVIDKFTANELNKPDSTAPNNLFDAINGCVKEDEFDDLPELQPETKADSDVVE